MEHEEGERADEKAQEMSDDGRGSLAEHSGSDGHDDGSDADAEVAEFEDYEDAEMVGAVKTRSRSKGKQKAVRADDSESGDDDGGDESDEDSKSAEEDWEADDDAGEETETGHAVGSRCIFCGQDEEHDPGEEYEEYLACCVCGDNAHRQCARDEASLASDEDALHWRCKDCVDNGLEADNKNVPDTLSRRRSSAPRMARDLLPSARGGIKPDSHSVFNTLILDEDPMDGSRALRKRKTPSDDADEPIRPLIRKRQRTGSEPDSHADADANNIAVIDEEADELAIAAENEVPAVTTGLDGTMEQDEQEEVRSPKSRSGRPQRHLKRNKGARIVSRTDEPRSVIVSIPITVAQWDEVERNVLKKQKRRERDRQRRQRNNRRAATAEAEEPQHFPAVQTTMYSNPFYAFPDREIDESRGKPYGGILNEAEADTGRTYPQEADRQAFHQAREKAEQEWKEKMAQANGETSARSKASGQPSKIKCINFGRYEIDTWHAAPYPEEYSRNKHLYLCEFCLKYMSSDYVAWRHKLKCSAKHPPGDEIYRSNVTQNPDTGAPTTLSFFEVDGRRNPLYCQNLCLLAKLFLGSKTLYYDVEPFLFYIMTENDEFGCHFVGYFSKEKRGCGAPPPVTSQQPEGPDSQANAGSEAEGEVAPMDFALSSPGNNVSCILVLPVHMRRGFGRVLIEFSYLLTKVEGRTGSPEKPLSDMGLVSYRSYWRSVLCSLLLRYKDQEAQEMENKPRISIAQIAKETGMTPDDIISTLEALRFLVRDPVTRTYAFRLDYDYMRSYIKKHADKTKFMLEPEMLRWTPYVMGRPTNLFALGEEANQPLQTVAPREEAVPLPSEPEEGVQQAMKATRDAIAESEDDPANTKETTEPLESQPNGASLPGKSHTPPPLTLTPQPSFLDKPAASPNRHSPRKTPNGTTAATPKTNSYASSSSQQHTPIDSIPPTRFEIFPAIPGQASTSKRRPGRPMRRGGGRSNHGTPARRSTAARTRSPQTAASGGGTLRRTRSKLADVALSAADQDEEKPDGAVDDGVLDDGEADAPGFVEGDDGDDDEEILYE